MLCGTVRQHAGIGSQKARSPKFSAHFFWLRLAGGSENASSARSWVKLRSSSSSTHRKETVAQISALQNHAVSRYTLPPTAVRRQPEATPEASVARLKLGRHASQCISAQCAAGGRGPTHAPRGPPMSVPLYCATRPGPRRARPAPPKGRRRLRQLCGNGAHAPTRLAHSLAPASVSIVRSSPDLYISTVVSQPPMNSPPM